VRRGGGGSTRKGPPRQVKDRGRFRAITRASSNCRRGIEERLEIRRSREENKENRKKTPYRRESRPSREMEHHNRKLSPRKRNVEIGFAKNCHVPLQEQAGRAGKGDSSLFKAQEKDYQVHFAKRIRNRDGKEEGCIIKDVHAPKEDRKALS